MKKLLIALMLAGTAISAMAQELLVLNVSIKGAALDEDEGSYSIGRGGLKGWIIAPMVFLEEGEGEVIFVEKGKGWYEQADYCWIDSEIFINSVTEGETKFMMKGVGSISFDLTLDEMSFHATTLGKFIYTDTEKGEKIVFAGKGSGVLEEMYPETDGYINVVLVKVNTKLTAGVNEVDDVEAYLEEALSKIVKDEVDIDFGIFY